MNKCYTYANTNFFGAGAVPSSEALRFTPPLGVQRGIDPFPGTGGTPHIPRGSVIGSNFNVTDGLETSPSQYIKYYIFLSKCNT